MQLAHGTRMIIDKEQPLQEPYKICFPVGCMSDYPVTDDMVTKMKKGQMLTVQAINMQGTPISLPLPLTDFAKAYDGPATDPKVFEDQQRKLQEELQKKAEEARKKLEAQQPARPGEEIVSTLIAETFAARQCKRRGFGRAFLLCDFVCDLVLPRVARSPNGDAHRSIQGSVQLAVERPDNCRLSSHSNTSSTCG